MTTEDGLQCAPIDDEVLRDIYQSDQDMYPAPLTFSHLQSWRDACPQFSILFRTDASPAGIGTIIVLPLQVAHWRDLLNGKLKETAIDTSMLAREADRGAKVGLHVFHVEKFESARVKGGFAGLALQTALRVANRLEWEIVGCSALTASAAGQAVFRRLSFEATGYREYFFEDGAGGYERTFLSPGETGDEQTPTSDRPAVSHSEMVVRYSRGRHW